MVEKAGSTEAERCKSIDPNLALKLSPLRLLSHNRLNGFYGDDKHINLAFVPSTHVR